MKYYLSLLLYCIGDMISRTTMQWGNGHGYALYNKIMNYSVQLDTQECIWKKVK